MKNPQKFDEFMTVQHCSRFISRAVIPTTLNGP